MAYTITPLCVGHLLRPKTNMCRDCGDSTKIDFPMIAFYIEGEGHRIMVDTGGSAPDGVHWMPYTRTPEEELDAALRNIGVEPEEIDTVLFTHIHWDHAGNNHLFPNARFIAQAREVADLHADGVETHIVEKTKFETVDGDVEIYPGLSVVLAPGHSPGMQCIVVDTAEGKVMLTGDLIAMYESWERSCPGGCYDRAVADASIGKIRKVCDRILPGHEPRVFSK
jgi:N-acyl homoserine lactone hydrolase